MNSAQYLALEQVTKLKCHDDVISNSIFDIAFDFCYFKYIFSDLF